MARLHFLIVAIAVGFSCDSSRAGEPNDFLARADKRAALANSFINNELNRKFKTFEIEYALAIDPAMQKREKASSTCSRDVFMKIVVDDLDHNFPNVYSLSYGSSAAGEADTRAGAKKPSDSPLKPFIRAHNKMWTPSFRVKTKSGEHVVGLDKIDHFFGHGYLGWMMIESASIGNKERARLDFLRFSLLQENAAWGLKGSGVKSFADIAAGDLGIAFWESLLDGPSPLFRCVDGFYKLQRPFDLFSLLDASVDETINCSSYASKERRDGIVGHSENLGLKCPVDPKLCKSLVADRPEEIAKLMFHPLCRALADQQIEEPLQLTVKDVLDMGSGLVSGGTNLFPLWFGSRKNEPRTVQQINSSPIISPLPIEKHDTISKGTSK